MDSKRWSIVAASSLALVVSQGPINVFATGIFIKPISQELGFGRGDIATAIGISSVMTAVASPFFGRLIDRYGVRTPLAVSIILFALATAAMSLLPGSVFGLYAMFALAGLVAIGQTPGSYSKVVSAWFDRQRGFALGIVLAGVGMGTIVLPMICKTLIGSFGWREAYLGLAGLIILLAFLPVLLFIREPTPALAGGLSGVKLPGVSMSEAARDRRFWYMIVSFFLAVVAINGSLVHVVPMLTDRGMSLSDAVAIISSSGLALIVGRLLAGWIIDRVFAPYVAVFFLVCPMVGLLILALQPAAVSPLVGVLLLGLGIGGETDLLSYMVSRYFGLAKFGTIYGWIFTAALAGNAVGSSILGWAFQLTHSYSATLIAYSLLLAVATALTLALGPYRYPPADRHDIAGELELRTAS
ncbi:MFS transporter [Bradyrhizobium sp. dw_411]|uniref:MFS transporter n=1 Tax=Bradyrhizobium sp. dw_411 TaxID=2720082 RepID=UPI001BCE5DCD|nr:MFS transporter [Bradyrhizobium sp. dw_411]